jgi:hypothetical protein
VETYEKLLARFPRSKHAAEVYYTLYLLYRENQDPKQNQYASLLKQQFPNSRFAKLIDQPDYLVQVSAGNRQVRTLYDSAFTLLENQQYTAANQVLNQIRQQFPDSDQNDKIAFLGVRIIGLTEQPILFKMALQKFLDLYPASALTDKARQYLGAIALYESGKLSEAEYDKLHPPKTPPPTPAPTGANPPAGVQPPAGPVSSNRELPKSTPVQTSTAAADPAVPKSPATAGSPAVARVGELPPGNTQPSGTNPPQPAAKPASTGSPAPDPASVPAKPLFADVNLQAPHLVVIAYPKGQAAFTGITEKVALYNSKYNAPDKLNTEAGSLNPQQDLVLVGPFANGQKAKIYVSKQKTPQSPLSKIRGIEFATFVVSTENLPLLLQAGKLEEYLTFYKNNY